jgi:phosphatidylglycerol---prolipoprotein diacylglyceryl transferase
MHMIPAIPALSFFVDSFNPVILHIYGPLSVRWYGVAYLCGFLCGYLLWLRAVQTGRTILTREQVEELLTWSIAGVLFGGRIGYMILYDWHDFIADPLILIRIDQGGMSFHGGYIGVVLAACYVSWRRKLPPWQVGDLCAMAAPFGLLFGRLANFINGELWGKISTVRWAMIFPRAPYDPTQPKVNFETATLVGLANPRHPSQLYEAALEGLVLGAIMLFLYWYGKESLTKKIPGLASGLFLILYAAARIACEKFREPDAALIMGMSRGTFYSLIMVAAGVIVTGWVTGRYVWKLWRQRRKREEAAATAIAGPS